MHGLPLWTSGRGKLLQVPVAIAAIVVDVLCAYSTCNNNVYTYLWSLS